MSRTQTPCQSTILGQTTGLLPISSFATSGNSTRRFEYSSTLARSFCSNGDRRRRLLKGRSRVDLFQHAGILA